MSTAELITIEYDDFQKLSGNQLASKIQKAYGPGALGVLTVAGVPNYEACRARLLPYAHLFANLPDGIKKIYEDEASNWSFGWSHGREILEGGRRDQDKGSYYANPCVDCPTEDIDLVNKFPSYCRSNIWPRQHLPEFEIAFKELGQLIVRVGIQVAQECDRYLSHKYPNGSSYRISNSIRLSTCHKARLLHYYPPSDADHGQGAISNAENGSWCGWHRDHGCLTGLTAPMYILKDGHPTACPDAGAGLYVKTREGQALQVAIPQGQIAYQLGEVAQVLSGGHLCATPHCVKAPCMTKTRIGVTRNTFAVFMQPQWSERLEISPWADEESIRGGGGLEVWRPGCTFGDFASKTISNKY